MTDPEMKKTEPNRAIAHDGTSRADKSTDGVSSDDTLPVDSSLERAVELLRADVAVRDEWRSALLQELSDAPHPQLKLPADFMPDVPARAPVIRRTIAVQPLAAVAACLVAMLVGVAGTLAFVHQAAPAVQSLAVTNKPNIPVSNAANTGNSNDKRQMIRFALVAPGAAHVSVVGDFNNWDPKATPLKTTADGTTWLINMPLSNGRHVYAFVVDGDIVADPSAPRVVDHDFGVQNSVILVGSL